jgi:hypothetical protein
MQVVIEQSEGLLKALESQPRLSMLQQKSNKASNEQ